MWRFERWVQARARIILTGEFCGRRQGYAATNMRGTIAKHGLAVAATLFDVVPTYDDIQEHATSNSYYYFVPHSFLHRIAECSTRTDLQPGIQCIRPRSIKDHTPIHMKINLPFGFAPMPHTA